MRDDAAPFDQSSLLRWALVLAAAMLVMGIFTMVGGSVAIGVIPLVIAAAAIVHAVVQFSKF